MRDTSLPRDIVFVNAEHAYPAHAIVLASLSPVIQSEVAKAKEGAKWRVVRSYPLCETEDVVARVIDFCYGYDLVLTPLNADCVYIMADDLHIKLLVEAAAGMVKDLLTNDTVVPSLFFYYQAGCHLEVPLAYVAEHFSELVQNDDMLALPVPVVQALLQLDAIGAPDESAIASWLARVIQRGGAAYAGLVRHLFLGQVGSDAMLELCACPGVDASELVALARSERISHPDYARGTITRGLEMREGDVGGGSGPVFTSGSEGVVQWLRGHVPGAIRVSASSTHHPYFAAENVLRLEHEHSVWYSENEPGQWIQWDFTPRSVAVEWYWLRTSGGRGDEGHLANWRLCGSNDGRTWWPLDERRSNFQLHGLYSRGEFRCERVSPFYRMLRLEQIGVNRAGDHSMILGGADFFGRLAPRVVPGEPTIAVAEPASEGVADVSREMRVIDELVEEADRTLGGSFG